ncbi:hypothetical protein Fmac_005615 [Flemingia macrophylla]|uniref:non-specific serine/threonine protein kinase n=1 Tax=Flemingia macrophylla TaxID=520843 RepID=A0ABD1NB08_9FABA
MALKDTDEEDDSSSPSTPDKDKKKEKSHHDKDSKHDKDSNHDKDSAPSPKSPSSDSPESAPLPKSPSSDSPKRAPSESSSSSPPPLSLSSPLFQSPTPPPQSKHSSPSPPLLSPRPLSPSSPPQLKHQSPPLSPPSLSKDSEKSPSLSSPLSPSPSPPPSPSPSPSLQQPLSMNNENSFPPPRKQSQPQFNAKPPSDRTSTSPVRGALSNDSMPGASQNSESTGSSQQAKHGVASFDANSTTGSSPPSDNSVKYIGYTLAGIFAVALIAVAVALVFALKRRKPRGGAYSEPYMPPLNVKVKSGANGHYYVQQHGKPGSLANIYGNGNVSKNLDSPQPKSAKIVFTYDMVMEITNSFSSENIVGEGGFGCVYKGSLADGKPVAVKQLKAGSGQGEREFKAEVEIISRVHHRHLVSLVGYCIFEQQRILIYEYVPNGTLHHHLHGSGLQVLDWAKRLKIAIGAAKGLAYLHEECSQKIIHRDIKSANILLDDAYEAQVADFGLAKLADAANSHVSTRVMGTFGYMAPEYATSGKLTDRSDVYSFGVVLLELVTGRKPVDQTQPLGDESLVEWARPLLLRAIETRDFRKLTDPKLETHFVESEMLRMIEAAAACVRHSAPKRPRMVQVVRALDSADEASDLSNGVKFGQSAVYNSGQYEKEIMMFRRMANGTFVDSDFDTYSREYNFSGEISTGSQHELMSNCSSCESETRAINRQMSSTE